MNEEAQQKCPMGNLGRKVFAVLLLAVYGNVVGYVVWGKLFQGVLAQYNHLWRPMQSPEWSYMPVAYLIAAVFFSAIYCVFSRAFNYNCRFQKGIVIGLFIWLLTGVVNTVFWYIIHPIPLILTVPSLLDPFLFYVGGGIIISGLCGKQSCAVNPKP
ncbi:MAG: hypothetical protein H6908_06310 [Hyphomicrobiales bacterium]|nr:hypothetical protein [Hyphomicrobiales bacterium]